MGRADGEPHCSDCDHTSLGDGFRFALPIVRSGAGGAGGECGHRRERLAFEELQERAAAGGDVDRKEHTSELQSLMRISYAVFCLKKKKNKINTIDTE